jgi:hypothetical protein
MMRDHLDEAALIDLLDGPGSAEAGRHLAGCAACAGRLEEMRGILGLAQEAEVPEPSPLYWQAFRTQVERRIAEPRRGWGFGWPSLAAAAAVLAGVVVLLPRAPVVAPAGPLAPGLPAWSALPPVEDDGAWELLQVAASTAPVEVDCGGEADCAAALSDEEASVLLRELQQGRSL